MEENPKVSIIIPCYNVGGYVEKCIRTICDQTYKNLQIIPVNDGSKDNTLDILNALAAVDSRIEIINKENAGVSEARNSGLSQANGEYVVFVDGDDYLAPDYVDYMLMLVSAGSCDMAISKNCFTKENEEQTEGESIDLLSPEKATALLLSPRVIVGCWNKIFRKSFIDKYVLNFQSNLYYGEGLYFITRAAQLANNVCVGTRKVYYYRRNNEASATSKFNINKYYNGEKSLDKIKNDMILSDPQIDLMMSLHKSMFCLGALSQAYAHNLQNEYKEDCKHWRTVIGQNLGTMWKSRSVSLYRKVLLTTGYLFPKMMSKLDMWRRGRIAKESVN